MAHCSPIVLRPFSYRYPLCTCVSSSLRSSSSGWSPCEVQMWASLRSDRDHFISCKLLRRTVATTRHDLIVQSLLSFIRSAGGAVFLEPKHSDGKRAASKTETAATSLGAARFRERQKHSKYDRQAMAEGATFFLLLLKLLVVLVPKLPLSYTKFQSYIARCLRFMESECF